MPKIIAVQIDEQLKAQINKLTETLGDYNQSDIARAALRTYFMLAEHFGDEFVRKSLQGVNREDLLKYLERTPPPVDPVAIFETNIRSLGFNSQGNNSTSLPKKIRTSLHPSKKDRMPTRRK